MAKYTYEEITSPKFEYSILKSNFDRVIHNQGTKEEVNGMIAGFQHDTGVPVISWKTDGMNDAQMREQIPVLREQHQLLNSYKEYLMAKKAPTPPATVETATTPPAETVETAAALPTATRKGPERDPHKIIFNAQARTEGYVLAGTIREGKGDGVFVDHSQFEVPFHGIGGPAVWALAAAQFDALAVRAARNKPLADRAQVITDLYNSLASGDLSALQKGQKAKGKGRTKVSQLKNFTVEMQALAEVHDLTPAAAQNIWKKASDEVRERFLAKPEVKTVLQAIIAKATVKAGDTDNPDLEDLI